MSIYGANLQTGTGFINLVDTGQTIQTIEDSNILEDAGITFVKNDKDKKPKKNRS